MWPVVHSGYGRKMILQSTKQKVLHSTDKSRDNDVMGDNAAMSTRCVCGLWDSSLGRRRSVVAKLGRPGFILLNGTYIVLQYSVLNSCTTDQSNAVPVGT